MEITNNSRHYSIPLVVGRRVAQIVFFDTCGTAESYVDGGKYQTTADLGELRRLWQPSAMLPKLYLDREATKSAAAAATTVEGKDAVATGASPLSSDATPFDTRSGVGETSVAAAATVGMRPVPRWATKLASACATVEAHSYVAWIALVASAPFSTGSAAILAILLFILCLVAALVPVSFFLLLLASSLVRVYDRVCARVDEFGEAWRQRSVVLD